MKKHGTGQFNRQPDPAGEEPLNGGLSDLPAGQTDWEYLISMSGDDAYRHALADVDNPPLTRQQLARMRRAPNPKAIRARLKMTQQAFARQFQISLGTLRDWEQGLHLPDSTATAYLRVIDQDPGAVVMALRASAPGQQERLGPEPLAFKFQGGLAEGIAANEDEVPVRWRTEPPPTATAAMEAKSEIVGCAP